MYNRYIPQPDGSFRQRRMNDAPPQAPETPLYSPPEQPGHEAPPHAPRPVSGFFRNLLPANFDTGDLIIVLLLLLLAGDSEEERNTAMLTLVLYLLM